MSTRVVKVFGKKEQPKPRLGKTSVYPHVAQDLMARALNGMSKNGLPLQTDNGRDALWDAYEALLDAAMYLRQHILERDAKESGTDKENTA